MTYGFTFQQVKKNKGKHKVKKTKYGYYTQAVNSPDYSLEQIYLKKDGKLTIKSEYEKHLFVEEGLIVVSSGSKDIKLGREKSIMIVSGLTYTLTALKPSYVYLFSGKNKSKSGKALKAGKTKDLEKKYWGTIETIVSKDYTGKRIFTRKGKQNSLEVHCNKHETYFVHSGRIKIGIRVGRAENKSIILNKGDFFFVIPGVMHMRIGIRDSVVMEVSTKDSDSDSHIVEDGRKYAHKEV